MQLCAIPSPDRSRQKQTFRPPNRRCTRRLFGEPEQQTSQDSTYDSEPEGGQGFVSHGQDFNSDSKHIGVRATVRCLEGLEHLKPPELDYGAKYLQPLSSPAKKTPRGFKSDRSSRSPRRSPRRWSAPQNSRRSEQQEHSRYSSRLDQEALWAKQSWGEPTHKASPRRVTEPQTSRPVSAYKSPRTNPPQLSARQPTSLKDFLAQGSSCRGTDSSALHPRLTLAIDADDGQDSPCIKAGMDKLPKAPSYHNEAAEISPASSLSALEDPFAHCASPSISEFEEVTITPRQASVRIAAPESEGAESAALQLPSQPAVMASKAAVAESVHGEDASSSSGHMLCPPPGSAVKARKKSRSIFTSCLPSLSKAAAQKESRRQEAWHSSQNKLKAVHGGGQESAANPFKGFFNIFTGKPINHIVKLTCICLCVALCWPDNLTSCSSRTLASLPK